MKSEKFWQAVRRNPWLINLVGSPDVASSHLNLDADIWKRTMSEWVEERVEYIAGRPWGALDFNARSSHSTIANAYEISVDYTIHLHIGGNEPPFTRVRSVTKREIDERVEDTLTHLAHWHSEYWAKQIERPLNIDAVVRRSQRYMPGIGIKHQTIEIYRPPADFRFLPDR